jgi:hypothetical protein
VVADYTNIGQNWTDIGNRGGAHARCSCEDRLVAGFDDVPEASRIEPALTTVRQDSEEKGPARS